MAFLFLFSIFSPPLPLHAAGAPAGSIISNQAQVTYTVEGVSGFTTASNVSAFAVAEILDVTLSWQDAAPVPVIAGDTDRVLSFRITNTGNGADRYSLTPDGALSGDDFDPVPATLVLDTNGNGAYDAGTDTVYSPGVNDPVLAADASLFVFVLCDIPSGPGADDTGNIRLTATSLAGNGAPAGTVIAGAGEGGTDAVVGTTGAKADAVGTYRAAVLAAAKSAVVSDPYGGTAVVPGAVITYTIVVSVSGAGATAIGVAVEDPVPDNSEYVAGSLTLNGSGLTDAADADAGDVGQTTADTVTVLLGDLAAGAPARTITFQVRVTDPT
ncbi:MAG: hypothetical protein ACOZBW_05980 [Thermodesulfobacteriota bacterium]